MHATRAKVTMFVGSLLLALTLAAPAAAAPAKPVQYSECHEEDDRVGNVYTICFKAHGVEQENESGSGNVTYTYHAKVSRTVSVGGEEIYRFDYMVHHTVVEKDGEIQVEHNRSRSESFTLANGTCTFEYNLIFANGELRHEMMNSECSPSA